MKIKGIIFDYGGTIDSNGMHWAEVIWRAWRTDDGEESNRTATPQFLGYVTPEDGIAVGLALYEWLFA